MNLIIYGDVSGMSLGEHNSTSAQLQNALQYSTCMPVRYLYTVSGMR